MSTEIYNKLRIIPIVFIIISLFIIGVNIINAYKSANDDVIEEERKSVEKSISDEYNDLLLDINKAAYLELIMIPDISETIAERIIEYRVDSGGFKKLEELLLIDGITKENYGKIIQYLTIKNEIYF